MIFAYLRTQPNATLRVFLGNNEQRIVHFCKVNVGLCLASSSVSPVPPCSKCSSASGVLWQLLLVHFYKLRFAERLLCNRDC